jgi:hypothetical protein
MHWARGALLLLISSAPLGTPQHLPGKRYFYGNPTASPCQPGEINVTLRGVPGIFCSPPCSSSQECPSLGNATLAPPGINYPPPPKPFEAFMVKAECAIELKEGAKATHCAMVCDPSSPEPRAGCPGGPFHPEYVAACHKVETIGICTYSTSGPPPPPDGDLVVSRAPWR